MDTLVFRLYAPMASWGATAIGEERPTHDAPTAGAIIGLLAAALGIHRTDEEQQTALRDGIEFAVKIISRGTLMRDYHTVQAPSARTGKYKALPYPNRRAELAAGELNTLLSSRDYRCDGLWIIAVRTRPSSPFTLEQLKKALQKPVFALYLGRKSCPLATPLVPQIIQADNWRNALDIPFEPLAKSHKQQDYLLGVKTDWQSEQRHITYLWSGAADAMSCELNIAHVQTATQWDEPLSRSRWQFRPRQVYRWQTTEAS